MRKILIDITGVSGLLMLAGGLYLYDIKVMFVAIGSLLLTYAVIAK